MRYLCTFGLSAVLVTREKLTQPAAAQAKHSKTAKAAAAGPKPHVIVLVLIIVGLLDAGCYSLYNVGFAWCGSALATIVLAASGQIATAVLSVLVLKRQLRARHLAAVTVVTIGLVLRPMDDILAGNLSSSSSNSDSKQTYGALLVVASALLFSILGVVYEKRSENPDRKVTQAQVRAGADVASFAVTLARSPVLADVTTGTQTCIDCLCPSQRTPLLVPVYKAAAVSLLLCCLLLLGPADCASTQTSFAVSGVSLTITLVHQLLYCLPNWHQLVTKPLAAAGLSTQTVLLTHAVYGMITAVHQYVQLRVLATHGAMSVGLVNAVRASVVSVVSSMLFCHVKPQLCLTYWRGISALVVTVGAVQWVIAGGQRCSRSSSSKQQWRLPGKQRLKVIWQHHMCAMLGKLHLRTCNCQGSSRTFQQQTHLGQVCVLLLVLLLLLLQASP